MCAAWCDDDQAYDRAEAQVDDHLAYDGTTDYDWAPDECSIVELCAALDELERVMAKGADETAELRRLIA